MKKIITATALGALLLLGAAPAFAESTSTVSTSTTPVNLPCMQTAIQARGSAILAADDAFWTATRAAMQTRLSAVIAAWGIADQTARQAAIKAANQEYRDALTTARKAEQAAQKPVQDQWKTAAAACGASVATSTRIKGDFGFGMHGRFGWGRMFSHRGF